MRSFQLDKKIGESQARINKTRIMMQNDQLSPEAAIVEYRKEYSAMTKILKEDITTSQPNMED